MPATPHHHPVPIDEPSSTGSPISIRDVAAAAVFPIATVGRVINDSHAVAASTAAGA